VARLVADEVLTRPAHYLRVKAAPDHHTNVILPLEAEPPEPRRRAWASRHLVHYTADRVFETIPEALRKVRRIERKSFAVLEADADPALRHAYPYDFRVFVMPAPTDVQAVFRTPRAAAEALQQVMQDTAAFASEIFGLFESESLEDSVGVVYHPPAADRAGGGQVERLDINETQIRQFLHSPLGGEIASRIQLQPDYHAMVESDVVLINTGVGGETDALAECLQRIEKLLARIRHDTRRHSVLYWGDINSREDPTYDKLLRRLTALLAL
jgi:hypothetical protein